MARLSIFSGTLQLFAFHRAVVGFLSAVILSLGSWNAQAADVTIDFTTPTNEENAEVALIIGGTTIKVPIRPGLTAQDKRDLILAAVRLNRVPRFTAEVAGEAGMTIKHLTDDTTVEFEPGMTGEKGDKIIARRVRVAGLGFDSSEIDRFDAEGAPSVFTAGFILGGSIFEQSVFSTEFDDSVPLTGELIISALYSKLLPSADELGIALLSLGRELRIGFSPSMEEVGVVFGTTALTDGAFGYVTLDAPEPASLSLLGVGAAILAAGAAMNRRRVIQHK